MCPAASAGRAPPRRSARGDLPVGADGTAAALDAPEPRLRVRLDHAHARTKGRGVWPEPSIVDLPSPTRDFAGQGHFHARSSTESAVMCRSSDWTRRTPGAPRAWSGHAPQNEELLEAE